MFQPWLERRADIGVVCDPQGTTRLHRIRSGPTGQFQGITIGDEARIREHESALRDIAQVVRERLASEGYTDAFGIDAFVDAQGRLIPICEINGRHTFGHVAHALREQAAAAGPTGPITLHFGDEPPANTNAVVPLCRSAWLARP